VNSKVRELAAMAGAGFEEESIRVSYSGRPMELGGMLRMTNAAAGIEFDEQLMYPTNDATSRTT
jgi:hypothetical protein